MLQSLGSEEAPSYYRYYNIRQILVFAKLISIRFEIWFPSTWYYLQKAVKKQTLMEETQLGYSQDWNCIVYYKFCIVDLSEMRFKADIFVHFFFI